MTQAGERWFGEYRLDREVGRGGMGRVWKAWHAPTERWVALKVLPADAADDAEYRRRFEREAKVAAGIGDPHVVPIHSYGQVGDQLYIDMALIDGIDLAALIIESGRLAPRRAVHLLTQVASAADTAHAAGLVHRDIKPGNILVGRNDFAYLIDFGIARPRDATDLTSGSTAVGTIAYMAPERFDGEVTAASDIYSLGCVLVESVTGRRAFPGDSHAEQINAHLNHPPPRPSTVVPEVPAALDRVVAKALAKKPGDRYPSAGEFARAAREALDAPAEPVSEVPAVAEPIVLVPVSEESGAERLVPGGGAVTSGDGIEPRREPAAGEGLSRAAGQGDSLESADAAVAGNDSPVFAGIESGAADAAVAERVSPAAGQRDPGESAADDSGKAGTGVVPVGGPDLRTPAGAAPAEQPPAPRQATEAPEPSGEAAAAPDGDDAPGPIIGETPGAEQHPEPGPRAPVTTGYGGPVIGRGRVVRRESATIPEHGEPTPAAPVLSAPGDAPGPRRSRAPLLAAAAAAMLALGVLSTTLLRSQPDTPQEEAGTAPTSIVAPPGPADPTTAIAPGTGTPAPLPAGPPTAHTEQVFAPPITGGDIAAPGAAPQAPGLPPPLPSFPAGAPITSRPAPTTDPPPTTEPPTTTPQPTPTTVPPTTTEPPTTTATPEPTPTEPTEPTGEPQSTPAADPASVPAPAETPTPDAGETPAPGPGGSPVSAPGSGETPASAPQPSETPVSASESAPATPSATAEISAQPTSGLPETSFGPVEATSPRPDPHHTAPPAATTSTGPHARQASAPVSR